MTKMRESQFKVENKKPIDLMVHSPNASFDFIQRISW